MKIIWKINIMCITFDLFKIDKIIKTSVYQIHRTMNNRGSINFSQTLKYTAKNSIPLYPTRGKTHLF